VITHLGKIIVTSDCATILNDLDVVHPAARVLYLNAQMQNDECGDGTNFMVRDRSW